MSSLRDPRRYREEAARFLKVAIATADSARLRDSYLALAIEFERLADVLEHGAEAAQKYIARMATKPDPKADGDTARARAAHYQDNSDRFRKMAETEPIEHMRQRLITLADQYQELATNLLNGRAVLN